VYKQKAMKNKDYLHSDLLGKPCNHEVFQETYETIRRLSWYMSKIHCDALGIEGKQREEYMDLYINDIEGAVVDLVNITIDKFEK